MDRDDDELIDVPSRHVPATMLSRANGGLLEQLTEHAEGAAEESPASTDREPTDAELFDK